MIRSSIRSIYHMHLSVGSAQIYHIQKSGNRTYWIKLFLWGAIVLPHPRSKPILVKYDLELIHVKNHLTDNIKYHFLLLFLCLDRGKYNGFRDNLF